MKKIFAILLMMLSVSAFAATKEQCKKADDILRGDGELMLVITDNVLSPDFDTSEENIDGWTTAFLKDYITTIMLQSVEKDFSEPVLLAQAITIKISAFYQHAINYARNKTDENKAKIKEASAEMASISRRLGELCPNTKSKKGNKG